MDANRCVSCGEIIPEGSHVCINCMPNNCVGCGWENKENCRACRMEDKLKEILAVEAKRIRGD